MSLAALINSIGHFFESLFNNTKADFNNLPKEQQDAIVQGVNLSQILKEGYTKGADAIVSEVSSKLNITTDVAEQVILHVLQSLGINVTDIQKGLDQLSERVQNTVTSDGWNGLWQSVAKFGASWLSTGSLNWVTLSLGVIEFAFQKIFKGVQ